MNVYFFQCQESYGNSVYLPYSSGILWAYATECSDITCMYTLGDIFFEKLNIKEYVDRVKDPDVLLFSNYGWNTNYHIELAKLLKTVYPNVKIIFGGPNAQTKHLDQYDFIDSIVWGEGENALVQVLRDLANNNLQKTYTMPRIININSIPSPYLSGIFDDFFTRYNYNFIPVWETHRGCPYHCSFCDLGHDYYNKVYMFDMGRLAAEIHWFSKNKIEYVEVADANFGIFPRDLNLVKIIKQYHDETGYPQKIAATWAKNSPDRILEMSLILDQINRGGVTLALQSNNSVALNNINRINIANSKLKELTKIYRDNNIKTYHDFILGIPGETFESWTNNLLYVLDINPDAWIFGHPLEAYENTELSDVEFIEKHGIQFAITPQISFFAKRRTDIPLEYGKYVVHTNTMNTNQWIDAYMFKYLLVLMHNYGWTNYISKTITEKLSLPLSDFYKCLYKYVKLQNNNIVSNEFNTTTNKLINAVEFNLFWGRQVFGTDDIYWEYEAATSCYFAVNKKLLFDFIKKFVSDTYGVEFIYIVDDADNQIIDLHRDRKGQSLEDFCKEIYWKGRRTFKWKK